MIGWHILDIETTGLDPNKEEIAELTLITCHNTEIVGIYHQFYQVSKMGEKAGQVNGLSIEQLRGWPIFSSRENIGLIRSLIKYPLFAHNSSFDAGFLVAQNVIKDSYPTIDTVKLCRKSNKRLENNKLQTWVKHYNLSNGVAHTALNDAFSLYRLIVLMGWQIYAKIGV